MAETITISPGLPAIYRSGDIVQLTFEKAKDSFSFRDRLIYFFTRRTPIVSETRNFIVINSTTLTPL